jgi:DNA-binding NarL/FixJ family response regulator
MEMSGAAGGGRSDRRGEGRDAEARGPLRVLIADDDPVVRRLVASMIEGEPSLELVGQAHDAEEAVALALEIAPDVALLDWRMPKGGGAQAAREMTGRCPDVALVALTSSGTEEAAVEMLRAGVTSFLVKGGSREDLVHTLHRVVSG